MAQSDDRHVHPVLPKQHRIPVVAFQAGEHGTVIDETAVARRHHLSPHGDRRSHQRVGLPSDLDINPASDTGAESRPDGFRVDDMEHDRLLQPPLQEEAQNLGAVAGRAAARVVGLVGQDNRVFPQGLTLCQSPAG